MTGHNRLQTAAAAARIIQTTTVETRVKKKLLACTAIHFLGRHRRYDRCCVRFLIRKPSRDSKPCGGVRVGYIKLESSIVVSVKVVVVVYVMADHFVRFLFFRLPVAVAFYLFICACCCIVL